MIELPIISLVFGGIAAVTFAVAMYFKGRATAFREAAEMMAGSIKILSEKEFPPLRRRHFSQREDENAHV